MRYAFVLYPGGRRFRKNGENKAQQRQTTSTERILPQALFQDGQARMQACCSVCEHCKPGGAREYPTWAHLCNLMTMYEYVKTSRRPMAIQYILIKKQLNSIKSLKFNCIAIGLREVRYPDFGGRHGSLCMVHSPLCSGLQAFRIHPRKTQ